MDIKNYQAVVNTFYDKMSLIDEKTSSVQLADDKWSLKEMIGHLIDSASNNHQRFIRLQESPEINIPQYTPEFWIKAANYQDYPWNEIIALWSAYNHLILHIIKNIDEKCLNHIWITPDKKATLDFLINDYYRHINWHIDLFTERLKEIKG